MIDTRIKALLDRANELSKSLLENPAIDFTAYRERVGHYNGLMEAVQILQDLERDEDERNF